MKVKDIEALWMVERWIITISRERPRTDFFCAPEGSPAYRQEELGAREIDRRWAGIGFLP